MTEDKQIYGSQTPLYSITNADVTSSEQLDAQSPFDFYNFLKFSKQELTPIQYNDAYQKYLVEWSNVKKYNATQTVQLVRERYVELLKDVTLNYLTYEERRFISAVKSEGFSNSIDVDIIIPFYSRKLREICNFYKNKRERLKHAVKRNQEKGSLNSVEHAVYETVTDYIIVGDDNSLGDNVSQARIESILRGLSIEVEELYDLYSSYLDNSPNLTSTDYGVSTQLRKDLYTSNTNIIDADLFINFDAALKRFIFENTDLYLSELGEGFTINYNTDLINLECKPDENLYDIISASKDLGNRVLSLRKKLIQKYIGADFYYIKTGSTATDVTSGVLFTADNPTGNLLNRHFPTTASVEERSVLASMRKIGLFFKPEKNGLLYFSAPNSQYAVDETKLEPNKVYIFPDPSVYGNTTGLTNEVDAAYPIIHTYDYAQNVHNCGSFHIEGDIKVDPYKQSFYAYYSQNQIAYGNKTNLEGLSTNFASLYNSGVITQWSSDIYGNQYSLIKSRAKKQLTDNRTQASYPSLTSYELYDGGIIRFNSGTLPEEASTDTGLWPTPNLYASNYYYNALFDGGIGAIINGVMVRPTIPYRIYNGMLFTTQFGEPDAIFNDANNMFNNGLTSFDCGDFNGLTDNYIIINGQSFDQPEMIINDTNNTFANAELILDCGTFLEPIRYPGDLTLNYVLSSIKYKDLDGGDIITSGKFAFARDTGKNLMLNEVIEANKTKLVSAHQVHPSKYGSIYVKDVSTHKVSSLNQGAINIVSKYSSSVQQEMLSAVESYGIYNDLIYFHTQNYFVCERLSYDGEITSASRTNNYIASPELEMSRVSDPFFFESRDYAIVCTVSAVSATSNSCFIIPTVYKIDYNTASLSRVPIQYADAILDGEGSVVVDGIAIAPLIITPAYDGLSFTTPATYRYDIILNYSSPSLFTSTIIIDCGGFIDTTPDVARSTLSTFSIDFGVTFTRMSRPIITYNSRNNLYSIITTLYDPNDVAYIHQMYFTYDEFMLDMKTMRMIQLTQQSSCNTLNWSDTGQIVGITINNITPTITGFDSTQGALAIYGS